MVENTVDSERNRMIGMKRMMMKEKWNLGGIVIGGDEKMDSMMKTENTDPDTGPLEMAHETADKIGLEVIHQMIWDAAHQIDDSAMMVGMNIRKAPGKLIEGKTMAWQIFSV